MLYIFTDNLQEAVAGVLGGPGAGPSGRAGRGPQHNHPPDQAVAEAVAETNKCDQHCTTLSIETSPHLWSGQPWENINKLPTFNIYSSNLLMDLCFHTWSE